MRPEPRRDGDRPMSEQTRYTLDEARVELGRRDCAGFGHDWHHVTTHGGELVRVVCERCGKSYRTEAV